jgi:hypothetical protein
MPVVSIPYGDERIDVELPDRTRFAGAAASALAGEPSAPPPTPDEERAMVRQAFERPLGMPRLRELLRPGSRVLIAFDDPTVASYGPLRRLCIDAVFDELRAAGADETAATLVCANALHRKWTRDELASIIGADLVERAGDRLRCHDAENPEELIYLGTTEHGYDVEVHRLVAESDVTVYINAGLHLGFSGGWKSVCVGLSTWRSIRHTHTPDGMSMSVRDNRMHRVLNEMGAHLQAQLARRANGRPAPRIFKVEAILANPRTARHVWAGTVADTRAAALDVMERQARPRRTEAEPADVVVYGVPNWSPYATFATMNPILTLLSTGLGYLGGYIEALGKPGCTVILATPVPEQWDMQHHPAYKEVWERVLPVSRDPYEISARFEHEFATRQDYIEQYRFGVAFHPVHAILATHPLKRLRHAGRVFVAGAQDPAVVRHVGFTPFATVEDALREAERIHGAECSILCVRY